MKKQGILEKLGPGLLYAGAAIGVSHLVQSTSAGANFGFQLVWAVILANLMKMPFFEFGPRYAAATGKTLLHGYAQLGKWAVWLFIGLTLSTMFIIQSAVTVVTAGLAQEIVHEGWSPLIWTSILLAVCAAILLVGRYSLLDKAMKFIIVTLAITTIVALIGAINASPEKIAGAMLQFDFGKPEHVAFLVALMGWMPGPLDISVWHSVWTVAKQKASGERGSIKQSRMDFNVGYWGTTVLALGFVALGAIMMYGSGVEIQRGAGAFAKQLISMYTEALGSWAYPVIALAAFTTMFSTTLTCLDAFSRVLIPAFNALNGNEPTQDDEATRSYRIWLGITVIGTIGLTYYALGVGDMKSLVNFATSVSFIAAPVWAFMNMRVIWSKDLPAEAKPSKGMQLWSWIGIILLLAFTGYYLVSLLG